MPNETLTEVQLMQRAGLSVRQTEVWYKMRIDGWTEGEVMRHLGISIGAVQAHLWRAEHKIRQMRELLEAGETKHHTPEYVSSHIPADKDCQPGVPTDYSNTPLEAAFHAETRTYIREQRQVKKEAA